MDRTLVFIAAILGLFSFASTHEAENNSAVEDIDLRLLQGSEDNSNWFSFVVRINITHETTTTPPILTSEICSGTLISPFNVLTTGNCFTVSESSVLKDIFVTIQSRWKNRKNEITVQALTHEGNGELAILRLPKNTLPLPYFTRLALLPPNNNKNNWNGNRNKWNNQSNRTNGVLYAAGWGASTNDPQKDVEEGRNVRYRQVSLASCGTSTPGQQNSEYICINDRILCHGDLGGPLLESSRAGGLGAGGLPRFVIGVADTDNTNSCTGNRFIDIRPQVGWIREVMRNKF